ncbi:MAG: hypothetical protein ACRDZ9_03605 [Acidimicrobiales bacterium]
MGSIFKAGRGLFSTAVAMVNTPGGPSRRITVGEVIGFAEREGHFVRPQTQRVCAAPTRLIERTVDSILGGAAVDAGRSGLAGLIDFSALWAFYAMHTAFGQALNRYQFLLSELSERGGGAATRCSSSTPSCASTASTGRSAS